MAIYRFRVILEDYDDVYRDIDIKSAQTFEDFHIAIQDAFKFDKKHAASFFVSDDYWRKGQEITLREADLPHDEIDIKKNAPPKKLMSLIKIAKYIDAPHQRFVYVFDPQAQWSFMVEMMKIENENPKTKYPACAKTVGTAPKQYKVVPIIKDEAAGDLALAALLGDVGDLDDDTEAYKTPINTEEHGIEEEDLIALEGEEGDAEDAKEADTDLGDDADDADGAESFGGFEEEDH